jgi:hypothetical protein
MTLQIMVMTRDFTAFCAIFEFFQRSHEWRKKINERNRESYYENHEKRVKNPAASYGAFNPIIQAAVVYHCHLGIEYSVL